MGFTAEGPKDTAEANVTARLYNSNPVRRDMPQIIEAIRRVLGIEEQNGPVKKVNGSKSTKESLPSKKETTPRAPLDLAPSDDNDLGDYGKDTDFEGFSDAAMQEGSGSDEDEEGGESEGGAGTEDEDVLVSRFASRLAPGSDEDSEGDSEGLETALNGRSAMSITPSLSPSISGSASDVESSASSSETSPPLRAPAKTAKPITSTTYIPSLMGGYISGSDVDEPIEDMKERKNRRGQRARQAIAEKKFGDKAKHLQRQSQSRDHGWDMKRGARDGDDRGKRGRGRGGRGGSLQRGNGRPTNGGMMTGANTDPIGPRKSEMKKPNQPLHPSWEAAKRAKEQKASGTFQGKKISFD